jgi:glycosyltransferase involved in cell wall biosynthesis
MQSGAYRAAIQLYEALLDETPDDADVLNDAALAYAQENDWQKAEMYLRRALDCQPDFEAAFFNLLDILIEARKDLDAQEVFEAHGDDIPDSADKSTYRERLDRTLPAYQGDGAPTAQRDTDTLRIAFVCGPDRKFITDIEREIGKRHEVRTAYFDDKANLHQIQRVMDWADVTWFEWCDKILVHASKKLRKTSRVVCRLHRYEAFSKMPQAVNWSFVDTLIPTTHHIIDVLKQRVPDISKRTRLEVISSTVDLDRYRFKERGSGFDIAYLGYLHHRKNPSLLLQCIRALTQHDDRYHLHIAGYFQQPEWELYFNHMLDELDLSDQVTQYGWVDDVATWLEDKQYLLLPTIHEGNPYSVLEAAARGIKPVVHSFPGSDELYPSEWTFGDVSEFVSRITQDPYDSTSYRTHVAEHYALTQTTDRIEELFGDLSRSVAPTIRSNDPALSAPPLPTFKRDDGTPYREGEAYLVLGMHRSGTSLTTQLLHYAGVYTGKQKDHLQPSQHNPKGYWELKELVKLDRMLLYLAGGDSYSPPSSDSLRTIRAAPRIKNLLGYFDGYRKWGMKDPRLCLTFPIFEPHLPEDTKLIWVKRNPKSIAKSLQKRDRLSIRQGIELTQNYWRQVEHYIADYPSITINFDDFFSSSKKHLIADFSDFLQTDVDLEAVFDQIVNPELRHH